MTRRTLVGRSLVHFWRTNVAVVLGVGVAVAVLAGALLVGESVRASLRRIAEERQGRADVLVTGTAYFREALAEEMSGSTAFGERFTALAPLIVTSATAESTATNARAAGITVYGVDDRFWRLHALEASMRGPTGREAWLSPALARELGAAEGDGVVLAVEQPSYIPRGLLQGRRDGNTRSVRLVVKGTLPREHLGEFSLRPQQSAVRAVFVPIVRLQTDLARRGRVNALLLSSKPTGSAVDPTLAGDRGSGGEASRAPASDAGATTQLLLRHASFDDLGITFRDATSDEALVVESQAGLMSDALVAAIDAASSGARVTSKAVLTYLATSISGGTSRIPYSTIAAMDPSLLPAPRSGELDGGSPPLWLNAWAAADLKAAVGETIALDYFIWNDDDGLETRSARFTFAGVLEGSHALDPSLTPDYPGLTDQTRMADWDPPFPVDLTQVRRVDEDYWERHRAAPKAFIRLEDGRRLWASKYGTRSSTRLYGTEGTAAVVRAQMLEGLSASLGDITAAQFAVVPLRDERESAARGTTDFGEYFVYFSFFLVVSALLLAALFYRFGVEQRAREIGLLTAVGFTRRQILLTLGLEGAVLAVAGTVLGMIGAWLFASLVVLGLRTWWVDAVGTTALDVHLGPIPLAAGAIGGLLAAVASLVSAVSALTTQSARSLVAGVIGRGDDGLRARRARRLLGPSRRRAAVPVLTAGAALGLIALAQAGMLDAVAGFFGAGLLLLVSGLAALSWWLRSPGGAALAPSAYALPRLGARSLTYRPGRTTLSVALIAFATFVIVSVTAFRKDGTDDGRERMSGTGGYTMLVETSVPLMHDPATAEGRGALNLADAADGAFARAHTARLRLRPGDDASCLNLYRPTRPRILGVPDAFDREDRFRFGSTLAETPDERAHPWRLLARTFSDGAVPAIVDANSLAYVFHLGLGDDIVLPPEQGRQVRLRVVGTLVDSMFQSEVLIGNAAFERTFPDSEGFGVFLFELDVTDEISAAEAAVERLWSDSGADAIDTGVRLASFHRVENTYLATFQTLGALGLLLGVFGLALILARNILERQRELGLLRAVGFEPRHLRTMVVSETAAMMVAGLATGAGAALVAIVPALVARAQSLPIGWLAGMGVVIFVAGVSTSLMTASLLRRLPLLHALRSE